MIDSVPVRIPLQSRPPYVLISSLDYADRRTRAPLFQCLSQIAYWLSLSDAQLLSCSSSLFLDLFHLGVFHLV
jgi:hypothetical protein